MLRSSVLCSYYARGVALVLVGLALVRLVGILEVPAWPSGSAWASSLYPYSVAFFYLSMALLFGYAGFFLRDEERDVCLLVEGLGLLMLLGAGGILLGFWLLDEITLTTHKIASLTIGSVSILLAEWARRTLPKEGGEGGRGEPQRS